MCLAIEQATKVLGQLSTLLRTLCKQFQILFRLYASMIENRVLGVPALY